ncbi:MAG: hypothetical protein KDD66_12675 [Bdellovibrionales bacterium]|nr:hypothetical protein [Bdellovibrionales bacterium]
MSAEILLNREMMPLARLSGSSREIGYGHGSLFADKVRRCWEVYKVILGGDETLIRRRANAFEESITAFEPRYSEEIYGIAEGSGLESWKIFALNARTEIFREVAREKLADECTSLYFRPSAVLGQNWDFEEKCESLMLLLELRPDDRPAVLMMAEPGIIGKIGFNSCGVGVCLNILSCPSSLSGVPVHVMLRRVVDSESFEEALEAVDSDVIQSASNMLIADDNGNVVSLELAGEERARYAPPSDIVFHTNHYLQLPIRENITDSSKARCQRMEELVLQNSKFDAEAMKAILLDKQNAGLPICREYVPDPDPGFTASGTNCSIIMELRNRVMHITPGNPLRHPFETHTLA